MSNSRYILYLASSVILTVGCNGVDEFRDEISTVAFSPIVEDGHALKSSYIEDVSGLRQQGFRVAIFNSTGGKVTSGNGAVMEYGPTGWAPTSGESWQWPLRETYTFQAISPADAVTSFACTADNVSPFTYSQIQNQEDLMLGYYRGEGLKGDNSTQIAPVKFYHALASVQFVIGDYFGDVTSIDGISLNGVAKSGECTPTISSEAQTFSWSVPTTAETCSLSQTVSGLTGAVIAANDPSDRKDHSRIGHPFLLLPQTGDITLSIDITGPDGNKVTPSPSVTISVSSMPLVVGQTTKFYVNYSTTLGATLSAYEYEPFIDPSATGDAQSYGDDGGDNPDDSGGTSPYEGDESSDPSGEGTSPGYGDEGGDNPDDSGETTPYEGDEPSDPSGEGTSPGYGDEGKDNPDDSGETSPYEGDDPSDPSGGGTAPGYGEEGDGGSGSDANIPDYSEDTGENIFTKAMRNLLQAIKSIVK